MGTVGLIVTSDGGLHNGLGLLIKQRRAVEKSTTKHG